MKYIIKKFNEDFILDELEHVRKQFVEALTYTMESANVLFDVKADHPLDIYIEYDFQQKNAKKVVYGFNLREEIAKRFSLDVNQMHSSKQLLKISKSLKELANDIENHYDPAPKKTLDEVKRKQDAKEAEYAKKMNRSYREVLRDALAEDEALKKSRSLARFKSSKEFLNANYRTHSDE